MFKKTRKLEDLGVVYGTAVGDLGPKRTKSSAAAATKSSQQTETTTKKRKRPSAAKVLVTEDGDTCTVCGSGMDECLCDHFSSALLNNAVAQASNSLQQPGEKDVRQKKKKPKAASVAGIDVEQRAPLTCEICLKVFKSSLGLAYHRDNVCSDDADGDAAAAVTLLKCPTCNKEFKSSLGFAYHRANVCSDEKDVNVAMLSCEVCNKKFKSALGLRYHKMNVCSDENDGNRTLLSCHLCKKEFKSSLGLKYHLMNVCTSDNNIDDDEKEEGAAASTGNSIVPSNIVTFQQMSLYIDILS